MVDWSFALRIILFGVILVFVILIALAIIMRLIEKFFGEEVSQQHFSSEFIERTQKIKNLNIFLSSIKGVQ